MALKGRLGGLLGSKSICTLLELFLEAPNSEAYAAQVQKRTGLAKRSVLEGLKKLESRGLLKRRERTGAVFYSLARENAIVKELAKLAALEEILGLFGKLGGRAEVYLYGSAARGEADENSDLDVLVVTQDKKSAIARVSLPENTKPLVLNPLEFASLQKVDPALYQSIMRDRLRIV